MITRFSHSFGYGMGTYGDTSSITCGRISLNLKRPQEPQLPPPPPVPPQKGFNVSEPVKMFVRMKQGKRNATLKEVAFNIEL